MRIMVLMSGGDEYTFDDVGDGTVMEDSGLLVITNQDGMADAMFAPNAWVAIFYERESDAGEQDSRVGPATSEAD